MRIVKLYVCETCESEYRSAAEARKCESIKNNPVVSVGDIVFAKAGYGWFDGLKSWVSNSEIPSVIEARQAHPEHGNCFSKCCTYQFYYVVTKIDFDDNPHEVLGGRHRLRYHLFTRAMTGKQGHESGWTFTKYHVPPTLVENPPKTVIRQSKALLGQAARGLL